MTDEEYGFLFHEAKVNLVAFKPIYLCSDELRKMVEMAIEKERGACAKLCDDVWQEDGTAYNCREIIIARGQA